MSALFYKTKIILFWFSRGVNHRKRHSRFKQIVTNLARYINIYTFALSLTTEHLLKNSFPEYYRLFGNFNSFRASIISPNFIRMKKSLFLFFLLCMGISGIAQNVQLHYDFGDPLYGKEMAGRPKLTSTVEMFRPDTWGSTFFFVDMDYTSEGVASAYWEIARELKFWKAPLSVHVEYNGGTSNLFSYKNCYLGGLTYSYNDASFSKGFTLTAMYKYIQKIENPNSFQVTGTWYVNFAQDKCSFTGFADFWREKDKITNPYGDYIFLAEPQFWVNLNKFKGINPKFNLSVGTEVELSNNFGARDGFYVVPTLALKWSFN